LSPRINRSLLPLPQELPADPLEALLVMQNKSRSLRLQSGLNDVQHKQRERAEAYRKFKKALKEAQEAKKKGGFWKKTAKLCNKLGKYGSVAAAVAIAVGTGGAGAPASLAIAGAAMSSASLAQSEFNLLEPVFGEKMAGYMEVGLGLGGMACTGFASGMAEGGSSIETVQRVVAGTSGAATATGGVATIQAGRHDAEALEREADALAARQQEQRLQRLFYQILDQIEGEHESEERCMASLRGAIQAKSATPLIAARRV